MNGNDDSRSEQRDLEQKAKRLFDASVESLDAGTRSRLNQGRQRALAELASGGPRASWRMWVPAASAAVVAAVVVLTWDDAAINEVPPPTSTAADFELLMDEADLEMLEDLEFYSWMETEGTEAGPDENVG